MQTSRIINAQRFNPKCITASEGGKTTKHNPDNTQLKIHISPRLGIVWFLSACLDRSIEMPVTTQGCRIHARGKLTALKQLDIHLVCEAKTYRG